MHSRHLYNPKHSYKKVQKINQAAFSEAAVGLSCSLPELFLANCASKLLLYTANPSHGFPFKMI